MTGGNDALKMLLSILSCGKSFKAKFVFVIVHARAFLKETVQPKINI